ncbi:MAG: SDR family oxidoreductase [Calditrichaceae bacterium]|jgi:dTDP-4-dehydrorhamnose reductase
MCRVVITGINGYIGQYLYLTKISSITLEGTVRDEYPNFRTVLPHDIRLHKLDLNKNIFLQLEDVHADILIHTAAMANLGVCEKQPQAADKINNTATENIARWCAQKGTRMIYLSTDIVFDGAHAPYSEKDEPLPINVYGLTKLKGEQAVLKYVNNSVVIRIALALGKGYHERTNFIDWIMDKLNKKEKIPLFYDEFRNPSPIAHLAKNIWEIALSKETGIFHLFGSSRFCRLDIGKIICKALNYDADLLEPVSVHDFTAYQRPQDVTLNTNRMLYNRRLILPGIDEVIREILQ